MRLMNMQKAITKQQLLLAGMLMAVLWFAPAALAAVPGITGPTFNLTAQQGYLTQPDGAAVYSWGYGCATGANVAAPSFAPFPGFQPFPFYPGYSANFFDGQHYVMKGGSARTAACMLRPSFRNWFQPHYRYVYAGFRCANK